MDCWVGFDIGGTKCAVCTGVEEAGAPCVLKRHEIATPATQAEAMERMCAMALDMTEGCRVLGAGRQHRWSSGSRARRAAQSAQPAWLERRLLDGTDHPGAGCARFHGKRRQRLRPGRMAMGRGPGVSEHGFSHLWDGPGRGTDSGRATVPGCLRHGGRAGALAIERLRPHGLRQGGLV